MGRKFSQVSEKNSQWKHQSVVVTEEYVTSLRDPIKVKIRCRRKRSTVLQNVMHS